MLRFCCSSVGDSSTQIPHSSVVSEGHGPLPVRLGCTRAGENTSKTASQLSVTSFPKQKTTLCFSFNPSPNEGGEEIQTKIKSFPQAFKALVFSIPNFQKFISPFFARLQSNKWLPESTFSPDFFHFSVLQPPRKHTTSNNSLSENHVQTQ